MLIDIESDRGRNKLDKFENQLEECLDIFTWLAGDGSKIKDQF